VSGFPSHLVVEAKQSICGTTDDFLTRFLGGPKMNFDATGKVEAAVDRRTHLRYEADYWHGGPRNSMRIIVLDAKSPFHRDGLRV